MLKSKVRIIFSAVIFIFVPINLSFASYSDNNDSSDQTYKNSAVQKATSSHKRNRKASRAKLLNDARESFKKHNASFHKPNSQDSPQEESGFQDDLTDSPLKKSAAVGALKPSLDNYSDFDQACLTLLEAVERERYSSEQDSAAMIPAVPDDPDSISAFIQATVAAEQGYLGEKLKSLSCRYLSTHEEHQAHLLSSISRASTSILITSWACYINDRNGGGLINGLRDAARRGVKTYLYYQKGSEVISLQAGSHPRMLWLKNIQQKQLNIHAKILMVDDTLTVGSYDWLQDPNQTRWGPSENESICLDPSIGRTFKEGIWSTIRSYRALSFNAHKVNLFEKRFDGIVPVYVQPAQDHKVTLLTTPPQHRMEFSNAFELAQNRIIFTVFSVTRLPQLLESFLPLGSLLGCLKRGASVTIIYNQEKNPADGTLHQHLSFLDPAYRPQITFIPMPNIHQKTLIVDDSTYMIGSYNFLSSADSLLDDYNYMETSVVFRGGAAQLLIKQFEQKYFIAATK